MADLLGCERSTFSDDWFYGVVRMGGQLWAFEAATVDSHTFPLPAPRVVRARRVRVGPGGFSVSDRGWAHLRTRREIAALLAELIPPRMS